MNKEIKTLEEFRLEMLEDLAIRHPEAKTIIFYEKNGENKIFIDYEMAENDKLPEEVFDDPEEYKSYLKDFEENGSVTGYQNILYPGEEALIVPLKEAIYILCDMRYPGFPSEVMAVWVNLWVKDITKEKLADWLKLPIAKLNKKLEAEEFFSREEFKEISSFLEFDMNEYGRKRSMFYFDEEEKEMINHGICENHSTKRNV